MAFNPMAADTIQDPDEIYNQNLPKDSSFVNTPTYNPYANAGLSNYEEYYSPGAPAFSPAINTPMPALPSLGGNVADPGAGNTAAIAGAVGGVAGAAGSILGTAGKIAGFLPGVGAVISGVSALGSVIMNWWAADKQMEANKKAQAEATKLYNQQMAESTRRYDIESAMKQKELKLQEKAYLSETALKTEAQTHGIKMDEEKLKLAKEQNQWDKWLMLMTNVSNMMSSPASRAGFAQLYK